jgi:hypothetical protein
VAARASSQRKTSSSITELDGDLAAAAETGSENLKKAWALIPAEHKPTLKASLDRRHKPRAAEVDGDSP